MKYTLRIFLAALALPLCATTASATDMTRGSGDLANPATWGGTLPTDRIQFKGSGTYTISSDVTFAGMFLRWGGIMIDASANNPTITMTAPMDIEYDRSWTFKGGTYDFGGTNMAFNVNTWDDGRFGKDNITLDGCIFTNSATLWLHRNNKEGCTYTLQNGAALHVNGQLGFTVNDRVASGLSLSVLSGSRVTCQKFTTDWASGGFVNHRLVVSGAGSSFVTTGDNSNENWSRIGFVRGGESFLVDDGANVDFRANGRFYIGIQGNSSSNSVTVTGGATAAFWNVYLGGWSAPGYNTFRVLDGAAVSTLQFYVNGGHNGIRGNELVISNATLTAMWLRAYPNYGYDSTIRIQGKNPRINITDSNVDSGQFIQNTTIVFDVPPEGWTNTTAIISAPVGGINGDATATICVNGMEECFAKMKAKAIIPLMASSTGAQFPQSVLDATNDAMPGETLGRCQVLYKNQLTASEKALFPSANDLDLFLRIKPILSTVVYIR